MSESGDAQRSVPDLMPSVPKLPLKNRKSTTAEPATLARATPLRSNPGNLPKFPACEITAVETDFPLDSPQPNIEVSSALLADTIADGSRGSFPLTSEFGNQSKTTSTIIADPGRAQTPGMIATFSSGEAQALSSMSQPLTRGNAVGTEESSSSSNTSAFQPGPSHQLPPRSLEDTQEWYGD